VIICHLADELGEFGSGCFIQEFGQKNCTVLFSAPLKENVRPNRRWSV